MKCFIDAGNTRVKWQVRHEDGVIARGVGSLSSESLFCELDGALGGSLQEVHVSTVGSAAAIVRLQDSLARYTHAPVRFHWTQARYGRVSCAYEDPSALGADRWHALVGAWYGCPGACMVVDAGSAITVDWLDGEGCHQGGYILPGRRLMLSSLRQSTDRVLFDTDNAAQDSAPGRSTTECVIHGVNWLLTAIGKQLGVDSGVPVVLTGGDAPFLQRGLVTSPDGRPVRYDPDLVLNGLACVEAGICAG